MQEVVEEMQIDQGRSDLEVEMKLQGVHHDWAVCKEIKPRNKSFKNAFTFPLCLFCPSQLTTSVCSEERVRSWHLQKRLWTQSTLRPRRIIKVPSVLLSRTVSLCPMLLLLLLFLSLFLFCSTWSVRALWGCLITLIHTRQLQPHSGTASFSFHSLQWRLPRRTLAHCKVVLKYFRRKCSPYSSTAPSCPRLLRRIAKPIFFFEKKDRETSNERITPTSFWQLNSGNNLLLCEKLISSFYSVENIFFAAPRS